MTRPPSLSHPFLLGFDDIERALDRVTKGASEGYPPYNIERMPRIDAQHAGSMRLDGRVEFGAGHRCA